MTSNTFDLLGTKPATLSVLEVIRDTKELIDLAYEIRDAKALVQEKEQRFMNEAERLTALAHSEIDVPQDDDFNAIIPENFTSIEALYTLVGIYQSAQRTNARIALLKNSQPKEFNWIAWTKSFLGDEISLSYITYLESSKKWNRVRIDFPSESVAIFHPGSLTISLPSLNAEDKDWWIEVDPFTSGKKVLIFHRVVSNVNQHTRITHRGVRLTDTDGFDYVPEKGKHAPKLQLVFELDRVDPARIHQVLDGILADPMAAFGVTP